MVMAKTICMECRQVYDTNNTTKDQKLIAEENFCSVCWNKLLLNID